eukprot:TRINITY_DN21008_c2_g2_i1.p1 TRINITY_DN21008_c2_g2~~TRINITY_DN21008_c2_g2_i1.p1  ORF type:complete len:158 (+),score=72.12 TRINITY_DN21008_c2_g2_i1:143-616(+)
MMRRSIVSAVARRAYTTGSDARVSASKKGLTMEDVQKDWEPVDHITMDMRPPLAADKFEEDLAIAKKRLMYQSGKRGMLEMDSLLGGFARKNIPDMTREELMQWHDILRQYDNDLYAWLVKRTDFDTIPKELAESKVYTALVSFTNDKTQHRYQDQE